MFENEYTLFFTYEEFDTLACKHFIAIYRQAITCISFDKDEEIVSVYIKGEIIDQEFLIDLMEAVDSPLIVTDRYCGSTETIKSLGLDSWVKY